MNEGLVGWRGLHHHTKCTHCLEDYVPVVKQMYFLGYFEVYCLKMAKAVDSISTLHDFSFDSDTIE